MQTHVGLCPSSFYLSLLSPASPSLTDSLLQQSPSPSTRLRASTLCSPLGSHEGICSPTLHTPRCQSVLFPLPFSQVLPRNITPGVQTAIHCQDRPSSSIHAGYLLHCPVHNPRTVTYYTYSPGIDAIDQISS